MKFLLACVLSLLALPAFAQTPPIVNPSGVEFAASTDHDTVANGVALVAKYTLAISTVAAPAVIVKTVDLGKPAPVAGKVTFTGLAPVIAALTAGDYVAVVSAEGPGGVTASVPSDPFSVRPKAPAAPGKPVWK